jgi:putative heme-binding domain-containing protein
MHADEGIRATAQELFTSATPGARDEVVQRYQQALTLQGDAARGLEVFKTNCTPCHQLHGHGNDVGPNLATVAQAGAEKILVNVLDPNRELNPQYVNYTVQTNDFESYTGIMVAETAHSITLKRAHGETDVVPRDSIESIRSDALSIMPEGFEEAIDPQAMADLIAFITSGE